MLPEEFWNYSICEILDLIESFRRRENGRIKELISMNFTLANQIGNNVAYILNPQKCTKPPRDYEVYPEVFKEEIKAIEEECKRQELELYKAKMTDFVLRHNNLRKGH